MNISTLKSLTDAFLQMKDGEWNGKPFMVELEKAHIPFQEWRSQVGDELARTPSQLNYKDPELSILLTRIPSLKNTHPEILKKLSPNALQKLGLEAGASIEARYPALALAASQTFD